MDQIIATLPFFTIISAIASVIYTFLSYRTLREIKAQRETTYKPDIIIDEGSIYIYGSENEPFYNWIYSYDKKLDIDFNKLHYQNRFGLKLYNIGLASAKNVKVKFSLDIDNLFELIKKSSHTVEVSKRMHVRGNKNFLEFSDSEEKHSGPMHSIDNQLDVDINHLLPINVEKQPFILLLPSFLLPINSLFIYNILNGKDTIGFSDAIKIQIDMQYEDIGNNLHKKQVDVSFAHTHMSRQESYLRIQVFENKF